MSSARRRRSIVAGTALLLAAPGCIVVPHKSEPRSAQIGYDSNAPVQVGLTTRNIALGILGKPSHWTQHDLAVGYLFSVKTGTATGLLMGPCMPGIGSAELWEMDDVWLEFDEQGTLRRAEKRLVKKHHGDTSAAWREFAASVPDEIPPDSGLPDRR